MPVDGKHSQPITAPISNHRGQRSTPVHHLSSFDVPVISCCLITGGSSIDLSVQSGGKGKRACREACLTHTQMHATASKCWMQNGDVIKVDIQAPSKQSAALTHTLTYTDSNAGLGEVIIKSGWQDRSFQRAALWEEVHIPKKPKPSAVSSQRTREQLLFWTPLSDCACAINHRLHFKQKRRQSCTVTQPMIMHI